MVTALEAVAFGFAIVFFGGMIGLLYFFAMTDWRTKLGNKFLNLAERIAIRKGNSGRMIDLAGRKVEIEYVNPDALEDRHWDPSHYHRSNIYPPGYATPVYIDWDKIHEGDADDDEDPLAYELIPSKTHGVAVGQSWIEQLASRDLLKWVKGAAIAGGAAAVMGLASTMAVIQYAG